MGNVGLDSIEVLFSYVFLGPVKGLIFYYYLRSQARPDDKSNRKYLIRTTCIRLLMGIISGILVFQIQRVFGSEVPVEFGRLGINPIVYFYFLPLRPLEWWMLLNLGKYSFNVPTEKRLPFVIKGTLVSYFTDVVALILAALGLIAIGGIC